MKNAVIALLTISLVFCMVGMSPAGDARPRLQDIPLVWKPTDDIASFDVIDLTAYDNTTFTIMPFRDMRKDRAEIGKNVEGRSGGEALPVTTKDDVAKWMTERFSHIMEQFGLELAPANGNFIVEADILKFYVLEDSVYKAEVSLKVKVKDAKGESVWAGITNGSAKRWGSSYKAENYYESLGNACLEAVHGLLTADTFMQAIRKYRSQ